MNLSFKKDLLKIFDKNIFFKSTFLKGVFMGITDMIPGISGGTIALLLGIYSKFLTSIKNINFKALFKLDVKKFFLSSDFKFLIAIFSGMLFSFISFSKVLSFLLSKPFLREMLFSFFLGLVLTSIYFLLKDLKITSKSILLIILGTIISFTLSYFSNSLLSIYLDLPIKLFISGLIAIFAMLLPGISGSFMFVLFGVYPIIISALSNITNFENIKILAFVFLGVLLGFLLFPRVILFFLNKFYSSVMSFLSGLMIGSLYVLWPFWSYTQVFMKDNNILICDRIKFPKVFSLEFIISFIFILLGFLIIFKIKQISEQKNIKKITK